MSRQLKSIVSDWPFDDVKNVAVITTRAIINKASTILYAYHQEEDGQWEFYDESIITEKDAAVISFEEITLIDKSVLELHDLKYGWYAYRNSNLDNWKYKEIEKVI